MVNTLDIYLNHPEGLLKQVADILPRSPVLEIIVQALRICICRQFSFNIDTDGPGTILYPMNAKIGIIMTPKDV